MVVVGQLGDIDSIARVEIADHLDDANGEQAGAALAHGAHGAGVDHERAARGLGVLEPQLEARVARLAGGEARALALAGEHRGERWRAHAVADHGGDAGGGGHLGGDDLRAHAARAERRGRVADLHIVERGEVVDLGHDVRIWVQPRVSGEQPVDVGHQDQLVGGDQHGDLGGEEVVVAEGDLVGGGRVVLVDHRQHAPLEQRAERLARVEVVRARAHVEERQQHLRAGHLAFAQQLVVDPVQLALADGAGSLKRADRGRALGQVHHSHPARDRAACDDDHLRTLAMQAGELVAHGGEHVQPRRALAVGDHAGSELDDQASHALSLFARGFRATVATGRRAMLQLGFSRQPRRAASSEYQLCVPRHTWLLCHECGQRAIAPDAGGSDSRPRLGVKVHSTQGSGRSPPAPSRASPPWDSRRDARAWQSQLG